MLTKARADWEKVLTTLEQEQQNCKGRRSQDSRRSLLQGVRARTAEDIATETATGEPAESQIEQLIAEEVARQEREAEARRAEQEAYVESGEAAEREARRGKSESKEETATKEEPVSKEEAAPKKPVESGPRIEAGGSATTETFRLSKNFAATKGKLPMPVTGTATIVGGFGTKKHNEWNVTTNKWCRYPGAEGRQ